MSVFLPVIKPQPPSEATYYFIPQDEDGNTSFHLLAGRQGATAARKAADLELMKTACAEYNDQINLRNTAGLTAAQIACAMHNWDILEHLVANGADICFKGPKFQHMSIYESAKHLRNHRRGEEAVIKGLELQQSMAPSVAFIRNRADHLQSHLFQAIKHGDFWFATWLVQERKFPVDTATAKGDTLLHNIAVDDNGSSAKDIAGIEWCLQQGEKGISLINTCNHNQETPGHRAAKRNAWVFVQKWVAEGGDTERPDKSGLSVYAICHRSEAGRTALAEGKKSGKPMIPAKQAEHWDPNALEPENARHFFKKVPLPEARDTTASKLRHASLTSPRNPQGLTSPRAGAPFARAPSFSFGARKDSKA